MGMGEKKEDGMVLEEITTIAKDSKYRYFWS